LASFGNLYPALLDPWSPTEPLLALRGPDGVYVFNAALAAASPHLVVGSASYVAWSPDGHWLVCWVEESVDQCTVVAVPEDGSERDTLYRGPSVWPMVWASDGNIYLWERPPGSRIRHRIAPPKQWREKHGSSTDYRPTMILKTGQHLSMRRFEVAPVPVERNLPALDSLAGEGHVLLQEEIPGGGNWLIEGPGTATHGEQTYIVDDRGRVVRSLGWQIRWTSVSADRRFLVGFQEVDRGDDVASAQLFVRDMAGAWQVPVPSVDYALNPRWSRRGSFVVYRSRDATHVARLEIGAD